MLSYQISLKMDHKGRKTSGTFGRSWSKIVRRIVSVKKVGGAGEDFPPTPPVLLGKK